MSMQNTLVLDAPRARRALFRGMEQMTSLLRPTLGPISGVVAIAGVTGTSTPLVLNNAADIARRTIEIDDPFEDMGAMLVRQLAWSVYEAAGDGAASAAVICCEMVRLANLYIAGGGNPMAIKRGIERAIPVAITEILRHRREVQLPADLARIVVGTVREPDLANMIGEIVEAVGVAGAIRVEDGNGTETAYDYVQGSRWESGCLSHVFLPEGSGEAMLDSPRILVVDDKVSAAQALQILELCVANEIRSLLIVAPAIADAAVALLKVNCDRGVLQNALAVRAPAHGLQREQILEDIAVITASRYIRCQAGEDMSNVALRDLGTARQAWVTRRTFGLLGGGGNPAEIRLRVSEVKRSIQDFKNGDGSRQHFENRIGNLLGASAIIRVGAPTSAAQKELRGRIESAVKVARLAFGEGCVPGGGASYVACVPVLERLRGDLANDEAHGVGVLIGALFAPIRSIAQNSGHNANVIEDKALHCCPSHTFDANRNDWVDPWKAGILDPLPVVLNVLEASTSTAIMALTTDVLVRRKKATLAKHP